MNVQLYHGDCLEEMSRIPDGSVDMILADLPYGTTACKWDSVIPFEPLWQHYRRIIKRNGAIVLTASQPFTSALVMSNPKWFRYCWVWDKAQSGNCGLAKFQPLKVTEDVCVFSEATHRYYPQMRTGRLRKKGGSAKANPIATGLKPEWFAVNDQYFPVNILDFPNCANKGERVHPTQKPVALGEYLIRTYTNEGETVLDNTMGSGSFGVAAVNTGRNFIGIEQDAGYYAIAEKRIADAVEKIESQLALT
jgi:site-specific DNA-methyltransferase (adenine-specific)